MLKSPAIKTLSYLFTARLRVFDTSSKSEHLVILVGLQIKKMHHFLLEIVNSMQIVSAVLVSKILSLFTISSCLIKTILPPPLARLS